MATVTRPLFSDEASGPVGKLLLFRATRHGPTVQLLRWRPHHPRPDLEEHRAKFARARAAWLQIPPTPHVEQRDQYWRTYWYRVPRWPEFWREYEDPIPPPDPEFFFDGSWLLDGSRTWTPYPVMEP
jgi:hypothetical protein